MIRFTIKQGDMVEREIQLDQDKITLGRREDNDIVLPGPSVSRNHAIVECSHGRYIIADSYSANGTLVNKKAITSTELADNDEIVIAPYTIIVNILE
ncbi:FHA domain-containing protein [bacterium]|nr:FHA domain-containing protein [bacterium]